MCAKLQIVYDQPEKWSEKNHGIIEYAALLIGGNLSKYTGLDAVESFNAVMGEIHVRFTSTLDTWASSLWGVIRYRDPEKVGLAITVHEMMHRFNVCARLKPQRQLVQDKINCAHASLWPGFHTRSMAEGDQPDEWLANLLTDYFMGLLDHNEAGLAARTWIESKLGEWVDIAMGRSD